MIIDLGEMPTVADIVTSSTGDPRPPRHDRRRTRIAAVLLATAFVVAASGVPVSRDLPYVRIPIGVNARLMVAGTMAVVSDRRLGTNEVAAYDLASGRPLWRSPLDGTSLNAQMFVASSSVVVQTAHDVGYDQVEGFALATGAPRWRMPALMVTPIPIGLLVYQPTDGDQLDAVLVDPVTGEARWRTPIGGDCDINLATDPSQTMATGLVEACQDTQEIVALDLVTGAVRARVHPDVFPRIRAHPGGVVTAGNDIDHGAPRLSVAYLGDVAILSTPHRYPGRSLSAFRTTDLKPLWSGVQSTNSGTIFTCGPDVCILDGAGPVAAFDRTTGRAVAAPPVRAADLAATTLRPLPGVTTTLVVVDAGQRRVPMPGIASVDYRTPDADGQSKAVRPAVAGNVWLAVAGRDEIRPVQLLRGVADSSCAVITSYVACTTALNAVTVWRLKTD